MPSNIRENSIPADLLRGLELIVFDFDGVFTDNSVYVSETGEESVRCWRSDGLGISRIHKLGLKTAVLSTEQNKVVSVRCKKLNIDCWQGAHDKAETLKEIMSVCDTPSDRVMFVGNDINDIPAFELVGVPVAVADAYPEVHPHVEYITARQGGYGAVRELCDLICLARSQG